MQLATDSQKVWTSYLSPSKSKPKITPFEEVIQVRILWLGIVNLFQTFAELDETKDNVPEVREIRELLGDSNDFGEHGL